MEWLWAVLVLVAVLLIRFVVLPRWWYAAVNKLPGPPVHWFWGSLYPYLSGSSNALTIVQDDVNDMLLYKHMCRRWMFSFYPWISVLSADAAKDVLSTAAPKGDIYDLLLPWLGLGLLTSTGERWHKHRRLITPSFHFSVLKGFVPVYAKHVQIMLEQWHRLGEQEIDLQPLIHNLTLDIIGECAFGFSINSQQSTSEYAKAILDCSELVTLRVFNPVLKYDALYHRTANGRRWLEAIKIVHALPETVIKERHEQRLKGIVKPNPDFLDVLMEAYTGDEKTGLTLQDVRDEVDTFMFEGHDTTGSGLQWILYAVAQRPEVEARIIEEVDQVLGDRLSPDWNDLKSFPYLAMVIKETLRLYPPVPFITRMATNEELTIMGHRVPKGVNVGIAVAAIHRNPEYWENPDVFDPERFSPERSENRHPFAYVPFSGGPRNCIGQRFALNEEITLLASIYRQFTIRLVPNQIVQPCVSTVLRPYGGLRVTVHPRNLNKT